MEIPREYNRNLLHGAAELLEKDWGVSRTKSVATPELRLHSPLALIPLPHKIGTLVTTKETTDSDAFAIQETLHHNYNIEVPIKCLGGRLYVRLSAHIYNHLDEYKRVGQVIKNL